MTGRTFAIGDIQGEFGQLVLLLDRLPRLQTQDNYPSINTGGRHTSRITGGLITN